MVKISRKGKKVWVIFNISPKDPLESCILKGSWNNWRGDKMKKKRNGDFYITKVLKVGEVYQFGYQLNGDKWIVDKECKRVPSPFGSENSILKL